jgi:hypothetical protein
MLYYKYNKLLSLNIVGGIVSIIQNVPEVKEKINIQLLKHLANVTIEITSIIKTRDSKNLTSDDMEEITDIYSKFLTKELKDLKEFWFREVCPDLSQINTYICGLFTGHCSEISRAYMSLLFEEKIQDSRYIVEVCDVASNILVSELLKREIEKEIELDV